MLAKYYRRSHECDSNCVEYICTCGKRVKHYIWSDNTDVPININCDKCGVVTAITELKITSQWD